LNLYKKLIRPALFRLDAERAHDLAIDIASRSSDLSFIHSAVSVYSTVRDERLSTEVAGMMFENPVGLAAGYDKSGRSVDGLSSLGFGHIEVGSVSIDPSIGNPKPRLFRLPEDEAVIVHYGLQNDGAQVVRDRLINRKTSVPVGVNIVKTNRGMHAPPDRSSDIIDEYVRAVKMLHDCADYVTLNLSCPNTGDGRDFFAEHVQTGVLLEALKEMQVRAPMFLKVSPLGGVPAVEHLLEAVDPFEFISGFIFNLVPGVQASLRSSGECHPQYC